MGGPGGPRHPQNSALLLQCPFLSSTPLLQGASRKAAPRSPVHLGSCGSPSLSSTLLSKQTRPPPPSHPSRHRACPLLEMRPRRWP